MSEIKSETQENEDTNYNDFITFMPKDKQYEYVEEEWTDAQLTPLLSSKVLFSEESDCDTNKFIALTVLMEAKFKIKGTEPTKIISKCLNNPLELHAYRVRILNNRLLSLRIFRQTGNPHLPANTNVSESKENNPNPTTDPVPIPKDQRIMVLDEATNKPSVVPSERTRFVQAKCFLINCDGTLRDGHAYDSVDEHRRRITVIMGGRFIEMIVPKVSLILIPFGNSHVSATRFGLPDFQFCHGLGNNYVVIPSCFQITHEPLDPVGTRYVGVNNPGYYVLDSDNVRHWYNYLEVERKHYWTLHTKNNYQSEFTEIERKLTAISIMMKSIVKIQQQQEVTQNVQQNEPDTDKKTPEKLIKKITDYFAKETENNKTPNKKSSPNGNTKKSDDAPSGYKYQNGADDSKVLNNDSNNNDDSDRDDNKEESKVNQLSESKDNNQDLCPKDEAGILKAQCIRTLTAMRNAEEFKKNDIKIKKEKSVNDSSKHMRYLPKILIQTYTGDESKRRLRDVEEDFMDYVNSFSYTTDSHKTQYLSIWKLRIIKLDSMADKYIKSSKAKVSTFTKYEELIQFLRERFPGTSRVNATIKSLKDFEWVSNKNYTMAQHINRWNNYMDSYEREVKYHRTVLSKRPMTPKPIAQRRYIWIINSLSKLKQFKLKVQDKERGYDKTIGTATWNPTESDIDRLLVSMTECWEEFYHIAQTDIDYLVSKKTRNQSKRKYPKKKQIYVQQGNPLEVEDTSDIDEEMENETQYVQQRKQPNRIRGKPKSKRARNPYGFDGCWICGGTHRIKKCDARGEVKLRYWQKRGGCKYCSKDGHLTQKCKAFLDSIRKKDDAYTHMNDEQVWEQYVNYGKLIRERRRLRKPKPKKPINPRNPQKNKKNKKNKKKNKSNDKDNDEQ